MGTATSPPVETQVTIEDRFVLGLDDLKMLRFECNACRAAITVPIKSWPEAPMNCPSCRVQWHQGPNSKEFQTINNLRVAMQSLVATAKEGTFGIRFEMDRPK